RSRRHRRPGRRRAHGRARRHGLPYLPHPLVRTSMNPSAFDLSGRLAVVTGCRRGIGLAMAEALAGAGADIIGVSATLEPDGSEVQRRVEALGRTFTPYRVDLADRQAA